MPSLRTYYRNEEFSDIQVQLVAADDRHRTIKRRRTESAADARDARLAVVVIDVFPAHKVELSKASDVLEMMVKRLDGGRPLQLAINPAQLDAARCMFALIYQVPDTHDHAMGRLNQAGLLHLALLAEEFGLPDITSSAIKSLQKCILDADLTAAFWSLPAWPDVLLPLMSRLVKNKINSQDGDPQGAVQRLVVHVLGDLEEVWTAADETKRRLLLNLPMAALKLLLESKQLKVAAEDTVLYTVCAFVSWRPKWTRCHAPVIQDFTSPNVDWDSRQKYKQAEAAVDWFETRMYRYKSADEQLESKQRQLAEVLGLVCLQRLSKLALSSVVLQLPWLALLSWQSRRGIFPWLHHPLVDGLLKVSISRPPSSVKSWTFQVSASVAELKGASRQGWTCLPSPDTNADMAAFAGMGWSAGFWPYRNTCSSALQVAFYIAPCFPGIDSNTLLWDPRCVSVSALNQPYGHPSLLQLHTPSNSAIGSCSSDGNGGSNSNVSSSAGGHQIFAAEDDEVAAAHLGAGASGAGDESDREEDGRDGAAHPARDEQGGEGTGQGDQEGDEEQQQQQQQVAEQQGAAGTGGQGLVVGIGGWNNFFNLSVERWKDGWCDDDWNSKVMPDDLGKVAALVTITMAE